MNITILGTGCPNCQRLEANTKQALEELKIEATVEKVTEIQEIISYGVMGMPALAIDGKVAVSGRIPDVEEIKKILEKNKIIIDNSSSGCSCGSCSCQK